MAVRSNTTDLQAMAKACWAALMHKVADTNDKNCHRFCPPCSDSWCGYQQWKAGAVEEEYVPKDSIPFAIFEELKPIWQSLTDKKLLQKCLRGAIQNRNESLNGMLWSICPKDQVLWDQYCQVVCCSDALQI